MADATNGWRELSAEELAALPEARLGGELAVLLVAAILATVALPAFLILWNISPVDFIKGTWTTSTAMFPTGMTQPEVDFLLSSAAFAFVWGALFIVATLLRSVWTAEASANMFSLALFSPPLLWLIHRWEGVVTLLPCLPYLILCLVGGGAFNYYIRAARQPNLYFRRRVRV